MKLIIDIPDELKTEVHNHGLFLCPNDKTALVNAIKHGTPLPKGHRRILDEKDILDTENNDGGWYDLVDMPEYIAGVKAIIEADKERSDKE